MKVRGQSTTICVPAFPLQTVGLEDGLDHTVGEVVQIQRPANPIWEHPAGSVLWLDGVDARQMRCFAVSTRINHVANDDEECSRPSELAQIQDRLF